MAASAGGQTAQQAAAQGRSAADVLALGLQTAVTEYLTEKLPFDEMLKASKTGGSIVKAILKTAASEGLEEWANDYLNTLGNNFILGSESEMRQAVKGLGKIFPCGIFTEGVYYFLNYLQIRHACLRFAQAVAEKKPRAIKI
jgi:hypothetical protein